MWLSQAKNVVEVVSTLNYLSVKVPTILGLRELHSSIIIAFHIHVISEHYVTEKVHTQNTQE